MNFQKINDIAGKRKKALILFGFLMLASNTLYVQQSVAEKAATNLHNKTQVTSQSAQKNVAKGTKTTVKTPQKSPVTTSSSSKTKPGPQPSKQSVQDPHKKSNVDVDAAKKETAGTAETIIKDTSTVEENKSNKIKKKLMTGYNILTYIGGAMGSLVALASAYVYARRLFKWLLRRGKKEEDEKKDAPEPKTVSLVPILEKVKALCANRAPDIDEEASETWVREMLKNHEDMRKNLKGRIESIQKEEERKSEGIKKEATELYNLKIESINARAKPKGMDKSLEAERKRAKEELEEIMATAQKMESGTGQYLNRLFTLININATRIKDAKYKIELQLDEIDDIKNAEIEQYLDSIRKNRKRIRTDEVSGDIKKILYDAKNEKKRMREDEERIEQQGISKVKEDVMMLIKRYYPNNVESSSQGQITV